MAESLRVAENAWSEEQVNAMLARSPSTAVLKKWISAGQGVVLAVRLNWMTTLLATLMLWGFAIWSFADENASAYFRNEGKPWVAQNFTWLYIATQDVWCLFLIYLCFSRFGSVKLGQPDEKPRYDDFSWFCMLFTCGVAVGLYVFGVAEPLYFYRQPTLWHSWNYDYTITKAGVENDAQRAQQAIFQTIYHWGIHGWVPYILLALLAGVVSFRWQLPMTIRACFYPLIGDHAMGIVGDVIDSLSIATTTFGVCTSLGLGVTQLSRGIQFLHNINCDPKANCIAAGGEWDINTYGADSCVGPSSTPVSCQAPHLADAEQTNNSYYAIIACITAVATVSVLTGLDRGILHLSKLAFCLGMVVCLTILYADNTWYLMNVMTQTTGYYLQYVLQVGFDCEAFQQLNFEFDTSNKFWGSLGANSAIGRLEAVGFNKADIVSQGSDCGDQPNPCTKGFISMASASALYWASMAGASYKDKAAGAAVAASLKAMRMSASSIEMTKTAYASLAKIYGADFTIGGLGVPCGSGWDSSSFDSFTQALLSSQPAVGTSLCGGKGADCTSFWSGMFPRCPETITVQTPQWGTCDSHLINCETYRTYWNDTNPWFMDWWTIFYWAWWITWAPFVGTFVALVSRGRTVRELIIGGFFCPTAFAIFWFSIFGGLAVKMQRVAEMALQVRPDVAHATATCAEHYLPNYAGGAPISPASKKLAEAGYYMLSCMHKDDQIYYLMEPYKNLTGFLHIFLWVGLVVYFLTSSDSGSMTDDMISASGLTAGLIPAWQKIYWCFTEGIVAIALVAGGSGSLKTLQAMSIIIGLPYTFLLCFMVPALYRALKREVGDTDICASYRFNTQIFDFSEGFKPKIGSPCVPGTHVASLFKGLVAPVISVKKAVDHCYPDSKVLGVAVAGLVQVLWVLWFILHIVDVASPGAHSIAWLSYTFMAAVLTFVRVALRRKYNIWGNPLEDFFMSLSAYPFVLAQMEMQVDTAGADAKTYFETADELIAEMATLTGSRPSKETSTA